MTRIAEVILRTALEKRPIIPVDLELVLEMAMDYEFPTMTDWFRNEVAAIISQKVNDDHTPRWGTIEAHKIVLAAVRQLPISDLRNRLLWEQVLAHKDYATSALQAFTVKADELAAHLGIWWEIGTGRREADLPIFLCEIVTQSKSEDEALNMLRHKGASWTSDLRMAVNAELGKLRITPAFPPFVPADI